MYNVEIKGPNREIAPITIRIFQKHGIYNQLCFSSFIWDHVEDVEEECAKQGIERPPFGYTVFNTYMIKPEYIAKHFKEGDSVVLPNDFVLCYQD